MTQHRKPDEADWEMTHEYDGRHFREFPDTRNYTGKHERGWLARLGILPFVGLAVGTILAFGLAGCGDAPTHTDAPEPTGSAVIDGKHNTVIREPNGFRNVSFLCFGTIGVYVTSRGDDNDVKTSSAIAVLANDPHCVG